MKPPKVEYSELDYWRGVIDADGSVGISAKNLPFISLTIKSEDLFQSYKSFLAKTFNHNIKTNRNKRDNIYNVIIIGSKAPTIIKTLYYENAICLDRKGEKAKEIIRTFT